MDLIKFFNIINIIYKNNYLSYPPILMNHSIAHNEDLNILICYFIYLLQI